MRQETFTIEADSGEAYGEFRSYALAHAWLIRNGLEFEPLRVVSLTSISKGGWIVRPSPLHLLASPSLAG